MKRAKLLLTVAAGVAVLGFAVAMSFAIGPAENQSPAVETSDLHALQGVSLLPHEPACPDCSVFSHLSWLSLVLDLNDQLPAGTVFAEATLFVNDLETGEYGEADLDDYSDVSDWAPGDTVTIPYIASKPHSFPTVLDGWDGTKALLVTTIKLPNGTMYEDTSLLEIVMPK